MSGGEGEGRTSVLRGREKNGGVRSTRKGQIEHWERVPKD